MGISHIHVMHKPHHREIPDVQTIERREPKVEVIKARDSCVLYTSPKIGDIVDSLKPLPISWNPSCLSSQQIDIILYAPNNAQSRIHRWESISNQAGSYDADILPRWWNATDTVALQISIVPHGNATFLSAFPAGPIFNATYTEPASGVPAAANTNVIDTGVTIVNQPTQKMDSGKIAAAVLVPLIFIGLCIAVYVKIMRKRGAEKRKRWTEAVDKRMSTISVDWKSVSGAGANAAIRNSMAVGNRSSSFSFGAIRPSSTFAVESDDSANEKSQRPMSQMRTGVGLRNPAALTSTDRVSRVSFAPDTRVSRVSFADSRPSGESRRTRAFHSAYVPPVPALPDQGDALTDESMAQFSPRQTQGPVALTPEDIHTIPAAQKQNNENDLADFMPALSMMRTGGDQAGTDDYLLSTPTPPTPTHAKPTAALTPSVMSSPVMSTMAMQPMPASVMSPDEMLRAYAERKKSMSAGKSITTASISYPIPAADATTAVPSSNNMRTLYNAATGSVTPSNTSVEGHDTESQYSGEVYQYTVGSQYAFGHHPNGSIGVGKYGGAQYAIGDDEEDTKNAYGGHV